MKDFISREAAIAETRKPRLTDAELRRRLAFIPAADVVEVRHGRFIGVDYDGYADGNPVYYEWICSQCGCVFEDDEPKMNYCPHCGAKMDGGPDDA